jgi:cytochrome c1
MKTLVLLLMLALLPVRALVAVTTGFCAFAHPQGSSAPAEHAGDSHHDGSPAHDRGDTSCSSCVEHCSSAAFAPLDTPPALTQAPAGEHLQLYQPSVASFIPDPLDPPPLAG